MMMFGGSQTLSGRVDAGAGTYVGNGCRRESIIAPGPAGPGRSG